MNSPNSTTPSPESWTIENLQRMIDGQVPEDFRLDYKSADALPNSKMQPNVRNEKKEEVGRDVTAFANSDGGVIIYGIGEVKQDGRSFPGDFDPVNASDMSTETLVQIIASHSEPTLVGVRVFCVAVAAQEDPSKVCFVVVIPKSDTAHMAKDGRYYFRNENTRGMMRDWQVRDAMNRRKWADVVANVELVDMSAKGGRGQELILTIKNIGVVLVKHFQVEVTLPMFLGNHFLCCNQVNGFKFTSLPEGDCYRWEISNRTEAPLFPEHSITLRHPVDLGRPEHFPDPRAEVRELIQGLRVTVSADDMPRRREVLGLRRSGSQIVIEGR